MLNIYNFKKDPFVLDSTLDELFEYNKDVNM